MELMEFTFEINGTETFTIRVPVSEEELCNELTSNDEYTVRYGKEVLKEQVSNPITQISRMTENEMLLIYNRDEQGKENIAKTEVAGDNHPSTRNVIKWDEPSTKLLLDKYEIFIQQVGPKKKFKTKKRMWEEIALDIGKILNVKYTHIQVENRYKTILKRKKEAVESNSRTGALRMDVPFENESAKIASIDDSVEPEVLMSANCTKFLKQQNIVDSSKKRKISQSFESDDKSCPKKKKTMEEVLEDIYQRKEENRERRHREKMEILMKIFEKKE